MMLNSGVARPQASGLSQPPGHFSVSSSYRCCSHKPSYHYSLFPSPSQIVLQHHNAAAVAPHHQHQQQLSTQQQQQQQPFDALRGWLTQHGGSVGHITAGDCQMGAVTVRGLVAVQDIPASTPVLSVPIHATLRDDRAPHPYPGAAWNACLAAELLQQRSKGTDSSLWPYLATLPSSCCSPLLLSKQHLHEVQYGPAMAAIASYQAAARESYRLYCQASKEAVQQEPQFSWEDWVWALHMVQSRSIRLAITGCKVMIPGIDLLNHGGDAANGQLVLSKASWQVEAEPAVCFVTTRDIQAGEQVLWSYGRRGNDDFFVYHGFVLQDNPDEDVVLFQDVGELLHWVLQHIPELQELQGSAAELQHLQEIAEAAALRANQTASAYCSQAAIPGTTSSLIVPLLPLIQQLGKEQPEQPRQLQQQQQQHRQGQHGSSHSSSSGFEASVLQGLRGVQLHRRLASLRLHSPEWGASSCPPSAPELILRRDGCSDVRLPAVLAALLDHSALLSNRSPSEEPAAQRHQWASLLQQVVEKRCASLLESFSTSVEADRAWQQQQQQADSADGDLMSAVVQYRLAKKQLFQDFVAGSWQ